MARELKVFGYTLITYGDESKRLGQRSHVRQCKAVVATTTRKEAIEKFGITQGEASGYMSETGNEHDIAIAMSKPGQVFAFALDDHKHANPIEIFREPHKPIPRRRRPTFEELQAARQAREEEQKKREFNRDELEHLVEMLAGANHPLSASIAEKARLQLG
jgi:hypothetical protein